MKNPVPAPKNFTALAKKAPSPATAAWMGKQTAKVQVKAGKPRGRGK